MKLTFAAILAGSATAFTPASTGRISTAVDAFSFGRTETPASVAPVSSNAFTVDSMPGALPPMGFWDPLGFAEKADEGTLKRYREAEITHGRVGKMLCNAVELLIYDVVLLITYSLPLPS